MTQLLFVLMLTLSDCETCKNAGTVPCPDCKGDFRSTKEVICKRERGVGCDGRGYRPCFKCNGDGTLLCQCCKGGGMVNVRVADGRSESGRTRYRNDTRPCDLCKDPTSMAPSGRVDCPECHELYLEQKEVGAEIVGESRPGDTDERLARIDASRRYWVYHEGAAGRAKKFVGMIRCPRCLGRGMVERPGVCASCKAGKVVCPDCHGESAASHAVGAPPFEVADALRVKKSCAPLDRASKESVETLIDEYLRLRQAIQRYASDKDFGALVGAVEASDKAVAPLAK